MNYLALLALSALPVLDIDPPCAFDGVVVTGGAGHRVALEGDTALVATVGVARVFLRAKGVWTEQGVLSYSNAPSAVALSGDTAFIGVPSNDEMASDAGSVYVFERTGTTWSLEQQLFASDFAAGSIFGTAVALEGDVAFVGAANHGPAGVAYQFERVGGVWSEVTQISWSGSSPGDGFGNSASLSANTLVVATTWSPFVYVFVESGGVWSEETALAAPVQPVGGGNSVAISGDTVIAGALGGNAFVHRRSGSEWASEGILKTDHPALGDAVDVCGDVAVVAARDAFVVAFRSQATVFVRASGTWSALATWGGTAALVSVAVDDGTVLVGEYFGASTGVEAFELPAFTAPSVVHRNAGTNPDSYRAAPAYIGQSLRFTIDLTTTGHDQALVIGFDSPFGFTLGGGQTLLCFDLLGSGGELFNTGFHSGPTVEIEVFVPNDLGLAGFQVCTQAVHGFGVEPFALSNAQDIVIGACL